MPHYHPTPNPLSVTSPDESNIREYASDETSSLIDQLLLRVATAQGQRPPVQTVEAQSLRMDAEKQSREGHTIGETGSLVYKEEETTSPDTQTGGDRVSQSSISNGSAASSHTRQSSPRSIVSPISSLYRAHARALTITSTSAYSHEKQAELRGGFRGHGVQSPNEDDTHNFRSYESPFSRRVKEKFRQMHAHGEKPYSEPSQQNTEPPALVDVGKCDYESETLGADSR